MALVEAKEKRRGPRWWRGILASAAAFIAIGALVFFGINNAGKGAAERELAAVERAVNRAVVSCYAIEGFYPPNMDYLFENYGLDVDLDKYYIQHEAVASNVYPTIWVVRR